MNVETLFVEAGALLEGHFQLSSGLHSARYLQCALVLAEPAKAERLGRALAALQEEKPDLVLSPAMGGLIIGHEVGRALGTRAYFAERENGIMTLRRGFGISRGEKVVVVEDVITTGKSSKEVIDLVRQRGADVVAALSIICRTVPPPDLGVPVRSLLTLPVESFSPAHCPQCAGHIPVVKPGSRTVPE